MWMTIIVGTIIVVQLLFSAWVVWAISDLRLDLFRIEQRINDHLGDEHSPGECVQVSWNEPVE